MTDTTTSYTEASPIESSVAIACDEHGQYAETGWHDDGTIYLCIEDRACGVTQRLTREQAAALMAALGYALHSSQS